MSVAQRTAVCGLLLGLGVERQLERVAGLRLVEDLHAAHDAARSVALELLEAVSAAQVRPRRLPRRRLADLVVGQVALVAFSGRRSSAVTAPV